MARIINIPSIATKKALQLGYRELLQYNLNAGDWNTLDITMVTALVSSTGGHYTRTSTENLSDKTPPYKNGFSCGLKANDNLWLTDTPRCLAFWHAADSLVYTAVGGAVSMYRYLLPAGVERWALGSAVQPFTTTDGVANGDMASWQFQLWQVPTNLGYTQRNPGVVRVRCRVQNKGTSTQAMELSAWSSNNTLDTNIDNADLVITAEALKSQLAPPTRPQIVPWLATDGSAAPLPEAFYIYWPFDNSRLCLMALLIEKLD